MDKVVDPLTATTFRFGLRHFVMMMGKLEINPATVNINAISSKQFFKTSLLKPLVVDVPIVPMKQQCEEQQRQ
jgi:hypothetical protein